MSQPGVPIAMSAAAAARGYASTLARWTTMTERIIRYLLGGIAGTLFSLSAE
jgi:type IV secretory pathway VirB2 component (pilin)